LAPARRLPVALQPEMNDAWQWDTADAVPIRIA
jgi:hypothetical protein